MEKLYIIISVILFVAGLLLFRAFLLKTKQLQKIKRTTIEEKATIAALQEENEVLNMEIEFLKKIYRTKLLKLEEASKRAVVTVD
jgi:regulator of replication initiation timing